ncbi:S8 family peptidase [Marinomonas rhizomae]|uniref:S8 family peptidase n=1 Tax=Marinomonas rhizomae TaxID=491948 RepID=UPI002107E5B1|nr:S8 family peptidase [Marinomonas rhizomae]UTV98797.1 S8 family peptidase [Marinomonas rhizomae]
MAGLAIWGDLTAALDSSSHLTINHKLESIKLLRHSGDNRDKHLGQVTASGISLSEIENFDRKRIYTLALSAKDSKDRGKPSAWSSELDALAVDYSGDNLYPRLFVVSAGNTDLDLTLLKQYPYYNELQDIHDPGQSWNVITVGACTNKVQITDDGGENFLPLAPNGGLSPYSTTSVTWINSMPIKPEVVFEGGNMGVDDYSATSMSSLQLLSTHYEFNLRLFSTFNATSAATALAAKFAADISALYPEYWPETVRGLIVHSADWSDAMVNQFSYANRTKRQRAQHLVRCVGYGVPNISKALWSANNSLVMIVEDELQPFEKLKGKDTSTKDMHIHDIPWPKNELLDLGDIPVKMTITLSYFIEPNPSSRDSSSKYRYPSHQLRFDVKRPTESKLQFLKRLSRDARDEDEGSTKPPSDSNWLLGDFRNKGSIHKDIWEGTAADLAERGLLAVYPGIGWWRTRKKLERYNKRARYTLIVSIETPSTEIDLYTPVEAKIRNRIPIKNMASVTTI